MCVAVCRTLLVWVKTASVKDPAVDKPVASRVNIRNRSQRKEFCRHALTIAARFPCLTTGRICAQSPPKMAGIPPNVCSFPRMSHNVRCTASKQYLCCIGTSSQMMRPARRINSAACEPPVIIVIDPSCSTKGI